MPDLSACGITEDDLSSNYVGISPRLLEAAATRTLQLVVGDAVDGFLWPETDYLSLKPTCSNAVEIASMVWDSRVTEQVTDSAWTRLASSDELSIDRHINETLEFVRLRTAGRGGSTVADFKAALARHAKYVDRQLLWIGPFEMSRGFARERLPELPVRMVKRILYR